MGKYVLITPAKNESSHIEKTVQSVINQNAKPDRWIIVNDHSSDSTEEIIRKYLPGNGFIQYESNMMLPVKGFASKVQTFNIGYSIIKMRKYDFIGNLDADVSFGSDYFEKLMELLQDNKELGITGGRILEKKSNNWEPVKSSTNSVAGAVQFFRRSCFEQIGGYMPLELGGIDTAAEITARASGWKVMTAKDVNVFHHKPMLTGSSSVFSARLKQGKSNYILGYHPLFHYLSSGLRIVEKPYLVSASGLAAGYAIAWLKKLERKLPSDIIHFLRMEQIERIKDTLLLRNNGIQ